MSTLKKLDRIMRKLVEIQKALTKVKGSFIYICGDCGEPYQKKGDLKIHCWQKHGKDWDKSKLRKR